MSIALAGVPHRKDDFLDFVVVGGGLAGLATAWSLQKAGHRVTLFEQSSADTLSKVPLSLILATRTLNPLTVPRSRSLHSDHEPDPQQLGPR